MAAHLRGDFEATCFRYPQLYGPYQVNPLEWSVIRRILDGRPHVILPDGGLTLESRGYVENVAHGILLAVDHPDISCGQIYNIADEDQLTLRQWLETISNIMDYEWEIVSMPEILAKPALALLPFQGPTSHRLLDIKKIKQQLGYRDQVTASEGFQYTVEWYLKNKLKYGGEVESRLQDTFNYDAEDRLIALYKECVNHIEKQVTFYIPDVFHPYAHTKRPEQQKDHR